MAPIKIHGTSIDPRYPPRDTDLHNASETNYVLLQATHRLDQKELAELLAHGLCVLDLIDSNNTYRCRFEPHDLAPLEDLDFVKHAIIYHQDFVLHDVLKDVDQSSPNPSLRTFNSLDASSTLLCHVQIHLHEAIPPDGDPFLMEMAKKLHDDHPALEVLAHENSLQGYVPFSSLESLAAMDQVMAITPVLEIEGNTLEARKILELDQQSDGNLLWYGTPQNMVGLQAQYQGSGEVVAVADSGFNKGVGATAATHPAFSRLDSGQGATTLGRVANTFNSQRIPFDVMYNGARTTLDDLQALDDQDDVSHGTAVAGCIVGNSWNTSYNPAKNSAYARSSDMRGSAPQARVFVAKWKRPVSAGPPQSAIPQRLVLRYSITNCPDVHIHNYSNSIITADPTLGPNRIQPYSPSMDDFMLEYPEQLVVVSAGNYGANLTFSDAADAGNPGGWSNRQISGYNGCKNVLTVGSSYNTRYMDPFIMFSPTATVPRYKGNSTHEGDMNGVVKERYGKCGKEAPGAIAEASSKGPSIEGFLKPDLVAPGVGILSAFSLHPEAQKSKAGAFKTGDFWSFLDPTLYNSNYCRYPEMQFISGTSFATPLVAGIAACVRSALRDNGCRMVLATTIKAILINTTISLKNNVFFYRDPTSPTDATKIVTRESKLKDPPDCIQGFGLANYRRSLIPVANNPRTAPSATEGYGWTGYHQVNDLAADCFANTSEIWPRTSDLLSDTDMATLTSCIYWDDAKKTQLRVTLAYNDDAGPTVVNTHAPPTLVHDLRLRVHQQVVEGGKWVDKTSEGPDDIKDYPEMDAWRADRTVKYGTIQKVTWKNITWDPKQRMRFQMRIEAAAITKTVAKPSPRVGFSLCWLASVDDKF